MSLPAGTQAKIHGWTWVAPALGVLIIIRKYAGVLAASSAVLLAPAVVLIGFTVFAAVHHADVLAIRVGEPFGSILLALAITVMGVAVILSVTAAGSDGADAVARDTVYAAVMIVLNGVVGLCLVVGGLKHYEQGFNTDGAAAILSVIVTTATITPMLPNFTITTMGPSDAPVQLAFVGVVSLILYVLFLFVQTSRHKAYFLFDEAGVYAHEKPGPGVTAFSAALLIVSLVVVILLARVLTPTVENAVFGAGLPVSFVGVIIAMLILLPETGAALRFAASNRLQSSLNPALGSALASSGVAFGSPIGAGPQPRGHDVADPDDVHQFADPCHGSNDCAARRDPTGDLRRLPGAVGYSLRLVPNLGPVQKTRSCLLPTVDPL